MILLNFSHPIREKHLAQITALVGAAPDDVREVKVHFDVERDFVAQVVEMVESLGFTAAEWESTPWLIVLPSLNYIAGVLLAELHGRMGHFPSIVRMRSIAGALVTEYEVAEIINLEAVRQAARSRR